MLLSVRVKYTLRTADCRPGIKWRLRSKCRLQTRDKNVYFRLLKYILCYFHYIWLSIVNGIIQGNCRESLHYSIIVTLLVAISDVENCTWIDPWICNWEIMRINLLFHSPAPIRFKENFFLEVCFRTAFKSHDTWIKMVNPFSWTQIHSFFKRI